MKEMAAYYYPTLVVFVDDSEGFLTSVSLELDTNLPYVTFSDPNKALNFIERSPRHQLAKKAFIKHSERETSDDILSDNYQISLALNPIWSNIYNPKRFNEISVVVVDYAMPGVDGIELCRKLRKLEHPHLKIIMLTGEADARIAVKAFNEGLIDSFLLKDAQEGSEELGKMIFELQKTYFVEQTRSLLANLEAQPLPLCWVEPEFRALLLQIYQQHKVVEHYPFQPSGSLLLLQADGTPLWLLVIAEKELKEYCEFAEGAEVPTGLLKLLKSGQKIPYFPNMDEYVDADGAAWEGYLHSAKKIQGEKLYYYALIKEPALFSIDQNRLVSFRYYLDHVWPPSD